MKITQVSLGGYDIPVTQGPIALEKSCDGYARFSPRRAIEIEVGLDSRSKDGRFWHELTHQIDEMFLGGKLEESEVNSFGNGLHQVMNSLGVKFDWGG